MGPVPGRVAYVWHGALHAALVAESLEAAGFGIRAQIIWDKTRLVIGRGDYHWQHEPCWYAVRKGRTGHWAGDRRQTTVWPIAHQKSETGHGTQKPVECMKRPLENNSSAGQAVYEPFCGSGTTIITAEMTGGSCHAVELSPPTSTSPCSGGKPSQAPSLPRRGRGHFCRGGRLPPR
jgi:DNA modification methylase